MTSLIEQAAKRLEQLRQAGVEMPAVTASAPPFVVAPEVAIPPEPAAPVSMSRRVSIDLDMLAATGIISPGSARSQMADQFRVIKRPLIKNAMGKGASILANGNLIMVTSALPGEGKSFTSINLAMSIATELDNTVMLVDADVARPSVMKMLGLPDSPGLLDLVLDDTKDLSSVLLKTNVEKLTILPSGTPHPRATELLASDAMVRLLEDIAARYSDRIVVFDSPPLLITTEARVLATHMGQIVVVVQAGKTLQSEVKQALATIESCLVKMLLLNRSSSLVKGGYGYGYGYANGYGQEQTE
jgi:exopolysaccharide/PEP-CTERM locus tyrosine autokinase